MSEPLDANFDWRAWMRAFGKQERRIREFLGLSQEQLARLAGVSQGAVSRLEAGRGLATPLLVVLKLKLAVARALRAFDPELLSDELRRVLELPDTITPPVGNLSGRSTNVASDPNVETLVRLYRDLPERQRQRFVAVVEATASALMNGNPAEAAEQEA